ncbi:hypothetical protein OIU76_012846 [Salix suchowensis]|nr:hypothetical protein OIU76_012846 [Salix suchowensis]
MEVDYNSKSEQLLQGIQNLPISSQIEKLKARIDLIAAACQFGTGKGPTTLPTLDKVQVAKTIYRFCRFG